MNNKFTYYDVVAIYIPGLLFSILASVILFCDKSTSAKDVLNIGFGFALFIMIAAYAIGEVIHSLSKFFEYLFWKLFKGWPALWIADDAYAPLRKIAISRLHLVSEGDRALIRDEIDNEKKRKTQANEEKAEEGNDSQKKPPLLKKDIESCFFSMKRKACTISGTEQNLNVMRSMAGFHSSMVIVSLLVACILPLGFETGDKAPCHPMDSLVCPPSCDPTGCLLAGEGGSEEEIGYQGSGSCQHAFRQVKMLALFVALVCLLRFCSFSVTYVKYLYVGYVAYIKGNNIKSLEGKRSDNPAGGEGGQIKGGNGTGSHSNELSNESQGPASEDEPTDGEAGE